ncbi:uncharacterized protein UTRI_00891 [Ustilago trichophora]|uniref:Uncharacterized protein n=1 Tax=Ustilago trichophora TaxID=86804 RepID=A0A5C3DSL8_9BASI|nr:uncharacterized protein UTRI_00891 [Ustilago trichophora]
MLISKQVFSLIAVLAIGSSIRFAGAESTVTSETIPNAPKVKPEHPLFACGKPFSRPSLSLPLFYFVSALTSISSIFAFLDETCPSSAVKSRHCRQSYNYEDLVYGGNLQMFDCSDERFLIQIWRRITKHFFKNAFYMYCNKDDKTCEEYVRNNKLDKISDVSLAAFGFIRLQSRRDTD